MSARERERQDDHELIEAANTGDGAAFEVLYDRYRDWVVGLAWRLTGDRELALDVMQETFVTFLGRFPGFELRSQLKTFLYPVVRHHAIAMADRRRRLRLVSESSSIPASAVNRAPGLTELAAAVDRLSLGHREVLILRFVDGLSLQEIAAAVAVPLGTVKSRLHHALAALRKDETLKNSLDP